MIVESLADLPSRAMHDLIDDARSTYPAATTKAIYRDYTQGHHRPIPDATRQAILDDRRIGKIVENMVGRCINELNGRIQFREFEVDTAPNVAAYLNLEFAAKNQLGRVIAAIVTRMLTDGNAACSISWRRGRPVLHHEQWWDGTRGMFVAASDTGEVFWAVSEWFDDQERQYRTVYQPDVIRRYRMDGNGWEREAEIAWTFQGKPIGVPVAHFPNGPSAYSPYAESTVGHVLHVQDALNAALFNRQVVSAFTGAQQYWASGVSEQSELEVGPGKLWRANNPAARFGAIPPGDMEALIKETNDLRQIIGAEFSVPTYRIGQGEWPSGVALVRADAPMIKRCQMLIDMSLKPGITYLAHRSTEMFNIFGVGDRLDDSALIEAVFFPPDEIDPGTRVEIDQAKVDLYRDLLDLPEPLLRKLDILSEEEIQAVVQLQQEREAQMTLAEAPREDQGEF